jgi:hypothetical protein
MSAIKRTLLNTILYSLTYLVVTFLMKHNIDIMLLLALTVVCFLLNYILYSVIDKAANS